MLSEEGKSLIERSAATIRSRANNSFDRAIMEGFAPQDLLQTLVNLWDSVRDAPADVVAVKNNIKANFDEAAKYLAGLLGLC
jgi:hypothetical protein